MRLDCFPDRSAQLDASKLSKDWFFYLMMAQKAAGDVQAASTLFGKRRGWKGRGHGSDLLGLALRLAELCLMLQPRDSCSCDTKS